MSSLILVLLTLAVVAVPFASGANDNLKGVATRHGSGAPFGIGIASGAAFVPR